MRVTLLPFAAALCVACGTKQSANRPDSAAPAAAAVATSSTTGSSTAELKDFINSEQAKYIDAVVKGDVAALSGFYADDAIVIAPNVKASHGRAEIDTANAQLLKVAKFTDLKLHTEDLQTFGDIGVETGKYEQTLQPKGKTLHDTGNYLVVWRKQGAAWKIYRLSYVSELPAPKT